MHSFIYDIPTKLFFGDLDYSQLSKVIKQYGNNLLLVYGGESIKRNGLYEIIVETCLQTGIDISELSGVRPNPDIRTVREGIVICREKGIEVVLAVGGGSVIDVAKWIAAGVYVDFDPWDFFSKWAPVKKALPIITVVTISGTGSEMDCSGVINNCETNDKIGRSDYHIFPKASFLDPNLTKTVNRYHTACGAIDIFSHVVEVYFNLNRDLDMFDCVMESIMRTVLKYAPIALADPTDYEARANLMWSAPWAINGLTVGSKKQSWSSHKIEHQLSAYYPITHGEGIAIIMINWLKYCLNEKTVHKYAQFGKNVFSIQAERSEMAIALESISRLETFCFETLKLRRHLSDLGVGTDYFSEMANKACFSTAINGFITLKPEDVEAILQMSL